MSTTSYPITLLAPARDLVVGRAAIDAGADAVYIGAPRFGARQAAGNSLSDISELTRYAHLFGAKVLVTLNTLLTDEERTEAVELAWQLYEIGVDALIIQDLNLLLEKLPPIRLHASTQCDNRTPEHVAQLERLGFQRVVLARELTIDEIRAIRSTTSVELEAFVHGALCVSYSGRCYISEVLMNRSANRGCCAQLCRMRYDLLDEDLQEITDDHGEPIHQRYLLSLQDLDRSLFLRELIDAGVTTFKIEGRLKDADYVTNVVAYYRQLLDDICPRTDTVYTRTFAPNPEKTFHRGGIDYFLHGRTPHMANWLTPKSTGEYIGDVISVRPLRVRLRQGIQLHNGDGLCFGDQGFSVNGINGDIITPNQYPEHLRAGTALYRNLDTEFTRNLHSERRIAIDITLEETEQGFRLTMGEHTKEFVFDHQPAVNAERAISTIRQQLSKLGDTHYVARSINIQLSQPYFLPISTLNQWRRETLK